MVSTKSKCKCKSKQHKTRQQAKSYTTNRIKSNLYSIIVTVDKCVRFTAGQMKCMSWEHWTRYDSEEEKRKKQTTKNAKAAICVSICKRKWYDLSCDTRSQESAEQLRTAFWCWSPFFSIFSHSVPLFSTPLRGCNKRSWALFVFALYLTSARSSFIKRLIQISSLHIAFVSFITRFLCAWVFFLFHFCLLFQSTCTWNKCFFERNDFLSFITFRPFHYIETIMNITFAKYAKFRNKKIRMLKMLSQT